MFKRLYQSIRLNTFLSARKRAAWLRKKKIFREMGENVSFQLHKIPVYPECISFHNNIVVASNVSFVTHDAIHAVFNRIPGNQKKYVENIGCIEIMDNCFIGANSLIMPNVRIGPNAIVAAGSVVTSDVPPNSVVGGVPAKIIGGYEALMQKRGDMWLEESITPPHAQQLPAETADYYWKKFNEAREQTRGDHSGS